MCLVLSEAVHDGAIVEGVPSIQDLFLAEVGLAEADGRAMDGGTGRRVGSGGMMDRQEVAPFAADRAQGESLQLEDRVLQNRPDCLVERLHGGFR